MPDPLLRLLALPDLNPLLPPLLLPQYNPHSKSIPTRKVVSPWIPLVESYVFSHIALDLLAKV